MRKISIFFLLLSNCIALSHAQQSESRLKFHMVAQVNEMVLKERSYQFSPKEYFPSNLSIGGSLGLIIQQKRNIVLKATYNFFKNKSVNTGINDSGYPKIIYGETQYDLNNHIVVLSLGRFIGWENIGLIPSFGMEAWGRNITSSKTINSYFYNLPEYTQNLPHFPADDKVYYGSGRSKSWRSVLIMASFDFMFGFSPKCNLVLSLNAAYVRNGEKWRIQGDDAIGMGRLSVGFCYQIFKVTNPTKILTSDS